MKLTVLGNSSPFPAKGSACSGYLLRTEGVELLLDAGTGVSGKFLEYSQVENLSGIIISHLHPDHCSDLIPLKYAIQYAEAIGNRTEQVPVWMPVKPELNYKYLMQVISKGYDVKELNGDTQIQMGSLTLTFHQTAHPLPCYAMSISDGQKRIVYTGDTGADEGLVEFAKGADLLLAECSMLSDDPVRGNYTHAHLTPEMVSDLAQRAQVKRLLLTHFWPYTPVSELIAKAKEIFPTVEASELGVAYQI